MHPAPQCNEHTHITEAKNNGPHKIERKSIFEIRKKWITWQDTNFKHDSTVYAVPTYRPPVTYEQTELVIVNKSQSKTRSHFIFHAEATMRWTMKDSSKSLNSRKFDSTLCIITSLHSDSSSITIGDGDSDSIRNEYDLHWLLLVLAGWLSIDSMEWIMNFLITNIVSCLCENGENSEIRSNTFKLNKSHYRNAICMDVHQPWVGGSE